MRQPWQKRQSGMLKFVNDGEIEKLDRYSEDEAVLLFDQYSIDSRRLHASFKQAGCRHIAVAIEDDGFLPVDVISVYGYFMGTGREKQEQAGEHVYFNEIAVPGGWKTAVEEDYDRCKVRGKLFYAGLRQKRQVKTVHWYDERDMIRTSDHYNRFGAVYARTTYDAMGQRVRKSWLSPGGMEVIAEDFTTGAVLLREEGEVKAFREKLDLVLYFFRKTGFERRRIFYNSLSMPFFVSNRLLLSGKSDVLFWQEPVGDVIPWNMQMILRGKARRTAMVMVQRRTPYERLMELGADAGMVHKLGLIYRFRKENGHQPEALICTNSEDVEHCREIVNALPQMHFHIVAVTVMSPKLMSVGEYENVTLYPAAGKDVIDRLFRECDFYLDINHMGEIVSAVYRAFLHNHLIFAFEETAHNRDYVAKERIYPVRNWEGMAEDIKVIMRNEKLMERCLQRQREEALAEDRAAYGRVMEQAES